MLVSQLTLGRQEGGQAPTRAERGVASSPASLLPRDHFHRFPPPGVHFGSGGGFGGQEEGVAGTSLLRAERQGKGELLDGQVGG